MQDNTDIQIALAYWLFALGASCMTCVYQMHQLLFSTQYKFLGKYTGESSLFDIPIAALFGFASGSMIFWLLPILIPSLLITLVIEFMRRSIELLFF